MRRTPTSAGSYNRTISVERELSRVSDRYRLARLAIAVGGSVLGLLAAAVPIGVLASAFSGSTTSLTASVDLAMFVTTLFALAVTVFLYKKQRLQAQELARLRSRSKTLEHSSLGLLDSAIQKLDEPPSISKAGTIFALGRLAAESSEDAATVRQILSAYVRSTAKPNWKREPELQIALQAAMSVLGRLTPSATDEYLLDLRGVDLARLDLKGAHLAGADLFGSILIQCDLTRAVLDGANLKRVNLERANLFQASLEGAILEEANLDGINGAAADFSRALLSKASIRGGVLVDAGLRGTLLGETDLSGADLTRADLSSAFLARVRLNGAHLKDASFDGAMLAEVSFSGAIGDVDTSVLAEVDSATLTSVEGIASASRVETSQ